MLSFLSGVDRFCCSVFLFISEVISRYHYVYKVIKSAGRDIILKVKRAYEEERDNNGPTVLFSKVRARVAYLTGLSERTVTQITQEGNVAAASSSKIVILGKIGYQKRNCRVRRF